MKYFISCFFLLFLSVVSVNAQTLSNIDFFAEAKKVIITYDLSDCQPGEYYDVTLNFVEQSTLKVIVPKTISGDIKKITCGSKRIVWDIGADVSTLSGKFYPELEVKKADNSNLTDIQGYNYKVVKIGNQVWMAENLKTAKYNDGTTILNVEDNIQWSNLTTGAWVYYNNDASNNTKYGKLYNWYAVSPITNGNKNVCPTGWHVPSQAEWMILTNYIGPSPSYYLKAITTWLENGNGSNSSRFNGVGSGYRTHLGDFLHQGYECSYWSSTEAGSNWAIRLRFISNSSEVQNLDLVKRFGFSVRCLKD
jgi:uncharacterized protein (TIGR02145 family)